MGEPFARKERPWFAWRPVKTECGRWVWLCVVLRRRWIEHGPLYFFREWSTYALLP